MLSGWIRYALLLGVVLSVSAQATDLAVNSFSFSNGAEFPGARGSLQISAAPTGDSIQALHYDFSKGGHYVQSILSLGTPVTASYLRFRINAPLAAPLSLRVVDATGQVLQFGLNRGTSATDELGWSELSVNITSSSGHYGGANDGKLHGAISQIDFIINASSASLTGTAYIRAVELLSGAPSTTAAVLPQHIASIGRFSFGNGPEFPGASGSLQTYAPVTGSAVQALAYDFTGGGHYVTSTAHVSPAVPGSYVYFRFWALSQIGVTLQVVDQSGQTLDYPVDRSALAVDNMGWATLTQRVQTAPTGSYWGGADNGVLQGGIAQIRLIANNLNSGSPTGTVYFNDLQILDHAPSQYYSPHSPAVTALRSITFDNAASSFPGATGSLTQTALSGGDVEQILNYNFTGGGHYVDSTMELATPVTGNTVRFLAQVPPGVDLMLHVNDSTGQNLVYALSKPLATLSDTGWVQFVVRLGQTASHWGGADDGSVHGAISLLQLMVICTSSNSKNPYNVTYVEPTGKVYLKSFLVDQEADQLDLLPRTPALAGLRAVGSSPMDVMALSLPATDLGDLGIAQSMGFRRVRFNLNWSDVERYAGTYNFSGYDGFTLAAQNYGLDPQAILLGNNTLYAASANAPVTSATNLNAYAAFAAAAAAHFKERGISYELWNEADLGGYTPAQFAALVKQAATRMHSADSSAQVIAGGLVQVDFPFLSALVSGGALGAATQGVGIHPYAMTVAGLQGADAPENAADTQMAALNTLRAARLNQPLWSSEQGASGSWYGNRDGTNESNLLRQALVIVRGVLSEWASNVAEICIYQLRDSASGYSATNAQDNFGLIDVNSNDKPAKTALQLLFDAANGRTYQGLLTGNPSSLQAMKFSGAGKETVYVVWSDNKDSSTASVTTVNACNANVDFSGKASSGAVPCVTDMLGHALRCSAIANERMSCPVSEAAGPIFIRQAPN
ncbi:MAG: hypothetical protein ACREU2_00925 [Steroidobacteraceae bacterium]